MIFLLTFISLILPTQPTHGVGIWTFLFFILSLFLNILPFLAFLFFFKNKIKISFFVNQFCVYNPKILNLSIYVFFCVIFSSSGKSVECMMFSHPYTMGDVSEGFFSILSRYCCFPDQVETTEVSREFRFPREAVTDPHYFRPNPMDSVVGDPVTHIINRSPIGDNFNSSNSRSIWSYFCPIASLTQTEIQDSTPLLVVPETSVLKEDHSREHILSTLNRLFQVDPLSIDYSEVEANFHLLYDIKPYNSKLVHPDSFITFMNDDGVLKTLKGSEITEENVALIYQAYVNQHFITITNSVSNSDLLPGVSLVDIEPLSPGGTRTLPMLKIQLPLTPFQEKLFWNLSAVVLFTGTLVGLTAFLPTISLTVAASNGVSTALSGLTSSVTLFYIDRGLNLENAEKAANILKILDTF